MSTASAALKPKPHNEDLNTGLASAYCAKMSADLSDILAATYRLTIKSHLYHWNVVGPLFKPLHDLTEGHYQTLFSATDIIAERIRALGHLAPVKFGQAAKFAPAGSEIADTSAEDMINDLIADHEAAARTIRTAAVAADEASDVVTTDMLTDRCAFHEKAVWMLKAIVAR